VAQEPSTTDVPQDGTGAQTPPISARVYVPSRKLHPEKVPNLWERLSRSKFPYRLPRFYGLILELRSSFHRIRLVWQRGEVRPLQMGPVWERVSPALLIANKRTRARTQGIQQLLSSLPWLSPEDGYLFLLGWDAGLEFGERPGTSTSSVHTES
jgi:hypothetical protein